jgi:hypothetical protein
MHRFVYVRLALAYLSACLPLSYHRLPSLNKHLMSQPADPIIQVEDTGYERIDTSTSSSVLLCILSFTKLRHTLQPETPMTLGQNDINRHGASPHLVMGLNPFSTCT